MQGAQGVRILGNTIRASRDASDYHGRAVPVWITNVRDVTIRDLAIDDRRPRLRAGILLGRRVEGLRMEALDLRLAPGVERVHRSE